MAPKWPFVLKAGIDTHMNGQKDAEANNAFQFKLKQANTSR